MAIILLIVLTIGKQYQNNGIMNLDISLMTYFYVLCINSVIEEYVFRGAILA